MAKKTRKMENVTRIGCYSFEEARKAYKKSDGYKPKFYMEMNYKNKKVMKELQQNARDGVYQTSTFGNVLKRELSDYRKQKNDMLFDKHFDYYLKLIQKHIHNVEGYYYTEELLANLIYTKVNDYNSIENNFETLSVPAAIALLDRCYKNKKYRDVASIVEGVEPETFPLSFVDSLHEGLLIAQVAQVIQDRHKKHQNYKEGNEHYGDYKNHEKDDENWNRYSRLISLLDDDFKESLISELNELGDTYLEESIAPMAPYVEKLCKEKQEADYIHDKIFKSSPKKQETAVENKVVPNNVLLVKQPKTTEEAIALLTKQLNNPLNSISNTFKTMQEETLSIELINEHQRKWFDAYNHENDIFDLVTKYGLTIYPETYKEYVENQSDSVFFDNIKNNNFYEKIKNPLNTALSYILAIDKDEDFMHFHCIYHNMYLFVCYSLPWLPLLDKKSKDRILELTKAKSNPDCENQANTYLYNRISSKENSEEVINIGQLMFLSTGMLLPRNKTITNSDKEIMNMFDIDDTGVLDNLVNLLSNQRQQIVESSAYRSKIYKKEIDKILNEDKQEDYQEAYEKLKEKLDEKTKSEYSTTQKYNDLTKKHSDLEKQYADDLKELAQLRELIFNMQDDSLQEEKIDIKLPITTDKKIVVFGGKDNWIAKIKENIKGDLKFYPQTTTIRNDMIVNADLVVIQTNYISHSMYYGVINLTKKLDVPFICLNNTSATKCSQDIINALQNFS